MVYTVMKEPMKPILFATLIMITLLLLGNYAMSGEKSEWLNENPCMIKVVITNTEVKGVPITSKEEKLV